MTYDVRSLYYVLQLIVLDRMEYNAQAPINPLPALVMPNGRMIVLNHASSALELTPLRREVVVDIYTVQGMG